MFIPSVPRNICMSSGHRPGISWKLIPKFNFDEGFNFSRLLSNSVPHTWLCRNLIVTKIKTICITRALLLDWSDLVLLIIVKSDNNSQKDTESSIQNSMTSWMILSKLSYFSTWKPHKKFYQLKDKWELETFYTECRSELHILNLFLLNMHQNVLPSFVFTLKFLMKNKISAHC